MIQVRVFSGLLTGSSNPAQTKMSVIYRLRGTSPRKALRMTRTFGKSTGGGRRKSARSQAPLLGTLSTIADDYRVGLVNLSSTGARVSAPCLPSVGEDVIFKAEKVVSSGHVIWSEGGQCGVAFERPITDVDAERLRNEASIWRSAGWSFEEPPQQAHGTVTKGAEANAMDPSGPQLLAP